VAESIVTWRGPPGGPRPRSPRPHRSLRSLLLLVLLFAAGCGDDEVPPARAPADAALTVPAAYDPGPPQYQGVARESVYLTMRDGVRLAADIWLPEDLPAGSKLPAILMQTRYWRSTGLRWPFVHVLDGPDEWVALLVQHGYACVSVDARGSGASFGTRPLEWSPDEVRDGAEIVDWIVRQPWSDGVVGAEGVSYEGTTAELLVTNGHPAVKAAVPRFSLFDAYTDIAFPGGVHLARFTEQWGGLNRALDHNQVPAFAGLLGRIVARGVRPVDRDRDGALLAAAVHGHADNYDLHEMARLTTFRDDARPSGGRDVTIDTASPSSHVQQLEAAAVPIYGYSGWFDVAYHHGAIKRHLTLRNPESRLILGPWAHGGRFTSSPANPGRSRFDHAGEVLKFLDHHLKGVDTGLPAEKPVHYFTMVEERWKAAEAWPPPARAVAFYLAAGRELTTSAPADAEAADAYAVDTSHGTGPRSRWDSAIGGRFVAYPDRAAQDAKLLVYESSPLARDTEVTGHPVVTLYVTSTAEDGAFFVYLEDVDAEGKVSYVTEGQLRALHRRVSTAEPPYGLGVPYRSFTRADGRALVPGEPAELSFDLLPTSYLFRKDHRIRVAVAGADEDHFALIPEGTPPTLRVHREAGRPSRVVLPVVAR
jgi:hypothetical protein